MTKDKENCILLIKFSGKHGNWKLWSCKILARGNKKGYKKHIDETNKIPTKSAYQQAKSLSLPRNNKNVWGPYFVHKQQL